MKTKLLPMFVAITFVMITCFIPVSKPGEAAASQIAYPDLVITSISKTGDIKVVDGSARVPIRVVVKNQGSAAAVKFKVGLDYKRQDGRTFAVSFVVPGQRDSWSPWTNANLAPGRSVTFLGEAVFNPSAHNMRILLWATADSCSGDEFVEDYCRVKELNEKNNQSAILTINLP